MREEIGRLFLVGARLGECSVLGVVVAVLRFFVSLIACLYTHTDTHTYTQTLPHTTLAIPDLVLSPGEAEAVAAELQHPSQVDAVSAELDSHRRWLQSMSRRARAVCVP